MTKHTYLRPDDILYYFSGALKYCSLVKIGTHIEANAPTLQESTVQPVKSKGPERN
jgi:hypothetical protein